MSNTALWEAYQHLLQEYLDAEIELMRALKRREEAEARRLVAVISAAHPQLTAYEAALSRIIAGQAADTAPWDRDDVQFARLLGEMAATVLDRFTPAMWAELGETMDRTTEQLLQIFDRAQARWDAIKAATGTTTERLDPDLLQRIEERTDEGTDVHFLWDERRFASAISWPGHLSLNLFGRPQLRFGKTDYDEAIAFVETWLTELVYGLPIPDDALAAHAAREDP